jgi:autotransporter-associated beta strand protein
MSFRLTLLAACALVLSSRLVAQTTYTWTGTTSGSFSNAANWSGESVPPSGASTTQLSFGSTLQPNVTLNANFNANKITFSSTAQHYYVGGSGSPTLGIGNGGIALTGGTSTYVDFSSSLNLSLLDSQAWNTAGNLSVYSNISAASNYTLTKTGAGYLALGGSSTYAGGTTISNGTLYITSSSTKSGNTITSGPVGTGNLTLASGTTLANLGSSTLTLDNPIIASGTVNLGQTTNKAGLILTGNISGGNVTAPTTLNVVSSTSDESVFYNVVLRGTNTFTGSINATVGGVILDSAGALPTGTAIKLGDDGYIGYTENGFASWSAFQSAITANRSSSFSGDTIVGIDSANASSPRTVSDTITLSGFGSSVPYLGSATNVTISGSVVLPSSGTLKLTGVNGGYLKITSPITATNNVTAVAIGASESEPGDASYNGYVELASGSSTYSGNTTLQSGYLLVGGSSTGTAASVTGGPLGTGTLFIGKSSGGSSSQDNGPSTLATSVNNLTLLNSISISNNNTLQIGVPVTSNTTSTAYPIQSLASNSLTLAGVISGAGAVAIQSGGTITLSNNNTYSGGTTINSGTLQIGAGGTTGSIAGNLADNSLLAFSRSDSPTFAGIISGTGNVTQLGTGTLTLSGANTYTGTTSVKAGVLAVSSLANGGTTSGIGASPNAAANLILDGGLLQYTGGAQSTDRLFTIGALGSGIDASGTGALTFTSSGSLAITGTNTSATVTLTGTSTANNTLTPVIANSGSGTTSVAKSGAGTWVLAGANTYTGATTINAGTLVISADNNLGSAPASATNNNLTFNGGTLETTASFTLNAYRGLMLNGAGGTIITDPGTTLTLPGPITGGNLTKGGTGTLTLSGASNYAATLINAGTLALGSTGSLSSAGDVTVNAGATFSVGNNQTTRVISGTGTVQIADGQTLTVNLPNSGTGSSGTFAGALTGNSTATFAEAGPGNLTLSGSSPSFAGAIVVSSGNLTVSNANALGSTAGGTTVASTGTLKLNNVSVGAEPITLNGNGASNGGALVGTGTGAALAGPITLNANSTIGTVSSTDVLTLSGTISESGGARNLSIAGVGTVVLTGQSTYSGITNINNGTLKIGAVNALPTTALLGLSGTLDVAANQTIAGFNNSANNSVIKIENGVTLNIALGSSTFSTFFSGNLIDGTSGGVLEIGSNNGNGNSVYLTGTNTYTGGTTIDAGGALRLGGNNGTTGSIVGNVTDNGTLIFNRGNAMTFAGTISGSGNVTQGVSSATTGTTTLTSANTYTGGTTINGGTLILANPTGSATGTGDISVAATGILQVGAGGTTGSIAGNITNAGTAIYNRSDSTSYAGVLSGTGNFVKQGSGTLTLTGQSTYTGSLKISAGTLAIGTTNALPTSSQIALATGSTLEVANNQTIAGFFGGNSTGSTLLIDANKVFTVSVPTANTFTSFAGDVAGSGTFAVNGAGSDIVLVGGNFANTVTQSNGTGATLVTPNSPIVVPTLLQFTGNTTQTLGGVISGGNLTSPVTLTFSAGNTTFTASNTYVGTTAVTGGKLYVNNVSGSGTGTGTVTLTGSGVLRGSGSISGPLIVGSGGTIYPGNSPGTFTSGPATFLSGGGFGMDINSASGSSGTNWSILQVTGGLTITATSSNPFMISLNSVDSGSPSNPLALANFNSAQSYSWDFVHTTTGISGFSANVFSFNTTSFLNSLNGGSFGVSQSGNTLFVNFTPAAVPEPSTWALLVSGLGVFAFTALRRRRKS